MAKLKLLVLAAALAAAAPATAQPVDRWSDHIAEASARFGIPEAWIRRVIQAESGGRTTRGGRPIVSRAGAQGLMQVMPGTWSEMRAAHRLGPDPHAPRDNILAGTAYLRAMYDRFGYPGLFAAYNAGPARYSEFLSRGRRLPSETVAYLSQVAGQSAVRAPAERASAVAYVETERPDLFVVRRDMQPETSAAAGPRTSRASSLFVELRGAPPR